MRKLAAVCIAFSVAVFLSNYIMRSEWLLTAAGICFFLGIVSCFLRKTKIGKVKGPAMALALGFLLFWFQYQMTTVPAQVNNGNTVYVTARILTFPEETKNGYKVIVRVNAEGIPPLKAVYYDYSGALTEAEPGDMLYAEAVLRDAGELYGESYDNYKTNGIHLICSGKTTPEIIGQKGGWILSVPQRIARWIQERIDSVFPEDSRAFLRALMLGKKDQLYKDDALYVAMSRAGFMHVVAVSGMHVTFLICAIQFLLGKRPKDAMLSIALVWLFVLVTGAPHSAVRAAFMQTILLLAPILRREADLLTSMSFALAVILLCNPYACASVSLQLSFAAVAGMGFISGRISARLTEEVHSKVLLSIVKYPAGILAGTLGVMLFTVPLTVIHFGYVAVLSFFTNLAGLFMVSICFCGGYAACIVDFFMPGLGKILGVAVSYGVHYLIALVKLVSSLPFAVVYVSHVTSLLWVVFVYVVFLVFSLFGVRPWLQILFPTGISAGALAILICFLSTSYSKEACFTVLDVGQGLCVVASSGDNTVIVDCGNVFRLENAGDTAGKLLLSRERHSVNLLVLTHLDSDHTSGIPRLLQYVDVHEILMPAALDEQDIENERLIREAADMTGTVIVPLVPDSGLTKSEMVTEYTFSSGLTVKVYPVENDTDSNDNSTFVVLSEQNYDILITGDADAKREARFVESHAAEMAEMEALVVGHHGSKYSSCDQFLQAFGGRTAVISVGYNTYGHPTNEVLNRLFENGYTVYRTDEDRNVTLPEGGAWPRSLNQN